LWAPSGNKWPAAGRLPLVSIGLAALAAAPTAGQGQARLGGGVGLATVYDSNLDHRAAAVPGLSTAASGDLDLRYSGRRLGLQLAYVASHYRYEGDPERNRTTHNSRAVLSFTPSAVLLLSVTFEGSFGGLSEDREIGTQYGFVPRVEIRPDGRNRLRLYSLHRERRYGELSGRDVSNHGAGLDYRVGGRGQPTLELGTRYERTLTEDERSRFNRWTHRVTFTAQLSSAAALTLGGYQSTRTYPERLVELEPLSELELLPEERRLLEGYVRDQDIAGTSPFELVPPDQLLRWRDLPRRDEIWAPAASLAMRALGLEVRLAYDLEVRFSNDLRRGYTAHSLGLRTRWRLR